MVSSGVCTVRGQTNPEILKPHLQRRLRNRPTDAERKLWQRLRGKQVEGCKFRRQHPYYDFILDFVCLERMLVVEVDGGQHADSTTDVVRDAFLRKGGFRILRFWNHEVLSHIDEVMDVIWRNLVGFDDPHSNPSIEGEGAPLARGDVAHHPHPNPPLEGEGVLAVHIVTSQHSAGEGV
ncbi:MAG: endonuclease domain-containing protein [Proteobacteria bacterium]|nr:endonuclease domain-containing protein [Pseudomonadota bacterium]